MTKSLSLILFDHCSISADDSPDNLFEISATQPEPPSLNPTTGQPMADVSIDVCGHLYGEMATQTMDDLSPISVEIHDAIEFVDTDTVTDEHQYDSHDCSGFMQIDDTISTFDDSHGAADWGSDFSYNADDW